MTTVAMPYRYLGRTGLRISLLSFGTWVTFAEQAGFDPSLAIECLQLARGAGVNLFDTADGYGRGAAEALLGSALEQLDWDRGSYLLATKLYAGTRDVVNLRETLNRKYLRLALDESLDRLRTPYVDLVYCHRLDPHTSLEEVVWTMSDLVAAGKAHYWGTSGWPAAAIRAACAIADDRRLRRPVIEQPEYSLAARAGFETEYAPLAAAAELGLGLVTWSPLASGLLTGKYRTGTPAGSRGSLTGFHWLEKALRDPVANRKVETLVAIAAELDASAAQLAIAWCARNPAVTSVLLGASRPNQLRDNLRALALIPRLTPEVMTRLDALFPIQPKNP